MRLVVVADPANALELDPAEWVLRLAGAPGPEESPPPDIARLADAAVTQLRAEYPRWLHQLAASTGVLSFQRFADGISWWWYAPISEKSCLRSPLMHELYGLLLLRATLDAHPEITDVSWLGDDAQLAWAAEQVVRDRGRAFAVELSRGAGRHSLGRAAIRRIAYTPFALVRWLLVRASGLRRTFALGTEPDADVLIYTRFPNMADAGTEPWRDRTFGVLPEVLERNGHRIQYVASWYGSLARLWKERRRSTRAGAPRICLVEAELGLRDFVHGQSTVRLFARFASWRIRHRHATFRFDGIDVGPLFVRELERSVFGAEVPTNVTLARFMTHVVERATRARALFMSFEYQPVERAVAASAHTDKRVTVVGIQAGAYNANQMGWHFLTEDVQASDAGACAFLPDLIAAFGALPQQAFAPGLGAERVLVCGGIRYDPNGGDTGAQSREQLAESLLGTRPAPSDVVVLVATSSSVDESLILVESVLSAAAERPELLPLFKFHPLQPLPAMFAQRARHYGVERARAFTDRLPQLLRASRFVVCGGTSTALEAMAAGSMPIVYRALGRLSPNPMELVADAVFTWTTPAELRACIDECLREGDEYRIRRSCWPAALAAHLRASTEARRIVCTKN